MKTMQFFLSLIILSILFCNCQKDEETNDEPLNIENKYSVTYINDTPSSEYEFWTEYDFDRKILLGAGEMHTDFNIVGVEFKVEYIYYNYAGLFHHRTGYFMLTKNDSIDFFDDLYNVEDGGIH